MRKERSLGRYTLRAVKSGSRQPLIEQYASSDEAEKRRVALERAGFAVIVTVTGKGELDDQGGPVTAGKPPW